MSRPEMESMLAEAGFERYRARQLYHWVFARGVDSVTAMGNLPARLRQWLEANTVLADMRVEKVTGPEGGTRKVLFRLRDGRAIESVLMGDEDDPGKVSICLSSQVGCNVGCAFCMTGFGGFQRQLTIDEITGQVLEIRHQLLGPDVQIGHVV
jgi:23S rRNA (adenine2503-C2)-methyltransferase